MNQLHMKLDAKPYIRLLDIKFKAERQAGIMRQWMNLNENDLVIIDRLERVRRACVKLIAVKFQAFVAEQQRQNQEAAACLE